MGCWSSTKLILKSADLFSKPVELKLKPSKKGGAAIPKVGSILGFCLSLLVVIIIIGMGVFKSGDMFDYKKIKYSSLSLRNKFDEKKDENDKEDKREIVISEYTFMPSIDFFFMNPNK